MICETRASIRRAVHKKWRSPAVVECLQEAGDDLFTFLSFPKAQWKALRTKCARADQRGIPSAHETQASLPSQDAVLLLLFGLLRSGQVKMRTIDGWHEIARAKQAA